VLLGLISKRDEICLNGRLVLFPLLSINVVMNLSYIYMLAFSVCMPKVTLFCVVRVAGEKARETEVC
jgi:hypothetical protein